MLRDRWTKALLLCALGAILCAPAQAQWTAHVNISNTWGSFSTEPSYDFDANGKIHMLFYDFIDSNYGIYYADNVGGAWTKSVFVWGAKYPILVITPDGVMHAFYKLNGIWEVTKPVSGGAWSAPVQVDLNAPGAFPQDVIVDNAGGIYVIYYKLFDQATPVSALYGRYKPLGGSWGPNELIYGTDDKDKWPMEGRIATYAGKFYCSYLYNKIAYYRIRATNGTWGSARQIPYPGTIGSIAFSPSGEMAVGYARDIGSGGLDYEVYCITSPDLGSTWSPEFCVSNSNWLSRAPMDAAYDLSGNLHITWQRKDSDPEDFDMWYRSRVGGVWQSALKLTNNGGRSGARHACAMKIRGGDVHFMYTDTSGADSFEDVYYTFKPGSPDTTPTGPVTEFTAGAGDNRAQLSWRNPADSDFIATTVRMSTSGYPTGPFSNALVCVRPAVPGSTDSYTAYPLTAGTMHYFSAFAQDWVGNWSVVANAMAAPAFDHTPPGSLPWFSVVVPAFEGRLDLSWTNPSDADFKGTLVRYKTTGYPASPSDGATACNRTAAPGSFDSYPHTGLTPGLTYYYRAFAYDQDTNYASGVTGAAAPIIPSCGMLKTLPDGASVALTNQVVTAIFSDESCIYVSEPDRRSGIRLANPGLSLAVGDRVNVTGTMGTRALSGVAAERFVSGSAARTAGGAPLEPVATTCKSIGGGPVPPYTPGVTEGTGETGAGINTIGSLVRITGRVTKIITSYIYIDDGSDIQDTVDGEGYRQGVMVRCASTPVVMVGDIVSATGVIEGSLPTGWGANRRFIRCRTTADLQIVRTSMSPG